jgi:putative ABC transport system ATP-binding protein
MTARESPGPTDSACIPGPGDAKDQAVRHPAARSTGASLLRHAQLGQRRYLYASVIFLSAHQVAEALIPAVVGLTMGRAVATGDGTALLGWLLALGVVYGVLTTSMRYGFRTNRRAVLGADHDLRMLLADRVLDGRSGVGGHLAGGLLSTASSDTTNAGMYNYAIAMAISGFAGIGVAVYSLARFSFLLAGLVVAGSVLLLVLTDVAGRPLARRSAAQRAKIAAATGLAADLLSGLRVLKGFGGERAACDRYRRASREALQATLRSAVAESAVRALAVLLSGILLAVVTFAGGRLAAGGSISLAAFITAIGLAQFLLDPLNRITGLGPQRARSRASAERIAAVLNTPYAVGGSRVLSGTGVPSIKFEVVSAGPVQELDLEVAPGEFLGIVAADTAEVLAVLDILSRDTDPAKGKVELDGQALGELDADSVRSVLLVPPHEPRLFEGTVLENIRAAAPEGEGEDLGRFLNAAAIDDLREALGQGLDTRLTEGGASLSGGQRQRVALARALAADPPVLVLHEPTTAVDSLTELNIAAGVRRLRAGKTTICVTSSPAILSSCDRVVIIDGGSVTGAGSHGELARSNLRYREIVLT